MYSTYCILYMYILVVFQKTYVGMYKYMYVHVHVLDQDSSVLGNSSVIFYF